MRLFEEMCHIIFFLSLQRRKAVGVLFKLLIDKTSNSFHITSSIRLYTIGHTLAPGPIAKPLPLSLACLLEKRSLSSVPNHLHWKP